MNLSRDGTKRYQTTGKGSFDLIALKVIFQGRKGLRFPFSLILTHTVFLFQSVQCFFFLFWQVWPPKMVLMKCEETDLIKLLQR